MKKYFILMLAAVGMIGAACSDDKKSNGGDPTPGEKVYDVRIAATHFEGKYIGSATKDGDGAYYLSFGDMPIDGEEVVPGNLLMVALYANNNEGVLPAGTYPVRTTGAAGSCDPTGTSYVEIISEKEASDPLFAKSGSIKITQTGDTYTVTCDLTLDKNFNVLCNYTGKLEFGLATISSLTEDKEVTFDNIEGKCVFYGDPYKENADTWGIFLMDTKKAGEGMQFEFLCPKAAEPLVDGPAEGVYKINRESQYEEGDFELLPGAVFKGDLYSTWFVRLDNVGYIADKAPATAGQMEITKHGSQYTITFELKDDNATPHTFKGSWTGTPTISKNE